MPTYAELYRHVTRHLNAAGLTALEYQEPEECPTFEEFLTDVPWIEFWVAFDRRNEPEIEFTFRGPLVTGIIVNNGRTNAHNIQLKEKLLEKYKDVIQWSECGVPWETTEDLVHNLCRGFPLNDGEQCFFLDNDGKNCVAVSAREALEEDKWKWMFLAESRFEIVADYCNLPKFGIFCKFRSKLLSPETTYGAYLVYKLPEGYKYVNPPPVLVVDKDSHPKEVHSIFLRTPQTPVISYNAKGEDLNPSNMPKMKGLPKQRSDGWMEVQVHEFETRPTLKMVSTRLSLSSYDMGLQGITVQCLEFRPI